MGLLARMAVVDLTRRLGKHRAWDCLQGWQYFNQTRKASRMATMQEYTLTLGGVICLAVVPAPENKHDNGVVHFILYNIKYKIGRGGGGGSAVCTIIFYFRGAYIMSCLMVL